MKEALKADLRDRIAEMKKLKEPMHLASFQYEQGVVLTGDEAKLFLELLETLPSPGEGVGEKAAKKIGAALRGGMEERP